MAKKDHICKDNEHMGSLAAKYDFFDWNTLWDTNQNLKRANPTVLYKARFGGDIVKCPEKKEKKETCQVDQEHVFQVPTYKMWLRLRILNEAFAPIKDTNYELEVENVEKPFKGKTKGGLIEHEIPVNASEATLALQVKSEDTDPPKKEAKPDDASGQPEKKEESKKPKPVSGDVPITWKLKIGKLNPIDEKAPNDRCVSGFQQRMNNLALNSGPVDGILGPNTRAAIKAFQDLYQLKPQEGYEGIPDGRTHDKLVAVHDSPNPPKPEAKKDKK